MLVTVLGFYGGYPHDGFGTSGYLLQDDDKKLLIDCGSGVLNSLSKYMEPTDLDAVVLSHYHHDHTADVGVLQYEWLASKKENLLPIYGHTQDFVNYAQLSVENATQGIAYNDYEPTMIGDLKFEFLKTVHPVPAYAIRVTDKEGKVLVYTADTTYFDGLVDFSKDADLLIADTNFPEDVTGRKAHLNTKEAGTLAKEAKVKRLMISHLPQTVDLDTMLSQTQKYAGDVPVVRAFQGLEMNL